jgi:hypothetical protein
MMIYLIYLIEAVMFLCQALSNRWHELANRNIMCCVPVGPTVMIIP